MPGAEATEPVRLVLDEASLDFRGMDLGNIAGNLEQLSDILQDVQRGRHRVFVGPFLYDADCADDATLTDYLFGAAKLKIGRDVAIRLARLLDKCPRWESAYLGIDGDVSIDGEEVKFAFSVNYALAAKLAGVGVACIVFPGCTRRGEILVRARSGEGLLQFYATADLSFFWRSLFADEAVPEQHFFELAADAFPDLLFLPTLSFRRFAGSYLAVRDSVVAALGALNDYFADAFVAGKGIPAEIKALLGRYGLDVSPESPKTRSSSRLMRTRDVVFEDSSYRCEWHVKLAAHRNRIHFSLPQKDLGGKIVVGIFAEHLPT